MRLNELVDLERPRDIQHTTDPHSFPWRMAGASGKRGGQDVEQIGGGSAATAFKSKKQNTIIKTSYHDSKDDGYIRFLKTIMDHQDNPFFPRIYNAKMYNATIDSGAPRIALVVEMERLHEIVNPKIPQDVRFGLLKSIGINYWVYDRSDWEDPKIAKEILSKSKNPKFNEAMKILEPLVKEFKSDIHFGNMMFRLTSTGPQLVITDPVMPSAMPYQGSVL